MKRKKISNNIERLLLTGLIVSTKALREIKDIYDAKLIRASYVRTISSWCFDYFINYGKAPGIHIQDIFNTKVRNQEIRVDDEEIISNFLQGLSDEYGRAKKFNAEYLVEQIENYFKSRALSILIDDIEDHINNDDIFGAEHRLIEYKSPQRITASGIEPLKDHEAIKRAFNEASEPILKLPGEIGKLINQNFRRGDFVSIMAPEKRGKSWWLMEMGIRGVMQKCNVAFFQAGDMTEEQQVRRIHIRLNGKSDRKAYTGKIKTPCLDCVSNQDNSCDFKHRIKKKGLYRKTDDGDREMITFEKSLRIKYVPCAKCRTSRKFRKYYRPTHWYIEQEVVGKLESRQAIKAAKKFTRKHTKRMKLSTYANNTLSVGLIEKQLDIWQDKHDFIPDIIIIDYADIMVANRTYRNEFRHEVNEIWKDLRALSQKRKCLVITATQADAGSYNQASVGPSNFTEDKRKMSHVTAIITLNQTPEEKNEGIMRIGQMFVRESDYDIRNEIVVLQSLSQGKPLIASYKPKGVRYANSK